MTKGYKAFKKGLICRGFQYEFGKDFRHEGKIELCLVGFHFCKNLSDVYSYYNFGTDIVVCEIESDGEVIDGEDGTKSVTNHLRIVRILNSEEATNNKGNDSLGHSNTGNWNTGNRNTGNWNTANYHVGSFNTLDAETVIVFNKPCKKDVWDNADKPSCLYFYVKKWVNYSEMTTNEKQNPNLASAKTAGGYVKQIDYKEAFTASMKASSKSDIVKVKALPNFDAEVFEEISGFKIN